MEQEPKENRAGCSSAPVTGYATDYHDQVIRQDGSVVGECWTQTDANQISCELNTMLRVNEDLRDIIAAESRELRAVCTARDEALAEARRLRHAAETLHAEIGDDSHALTFQSFGQYRDAMRRRLRELFAGESHNIEAEPRAQQNNESKGN